MNTKKQTVWLMTMLGLMVVLSAYYLFTEDVQNVPLAFTPPTNTDTIVTPEQATATPPKRLLLPHRTLRKRQKTPRPPHQKHKKQQSMRPPLPL